MSAHRPTIIGHGGVVEDVRLHYPVKIQVLILVGDKLVETLTKVRIVFVGLELSIVLGVTTSWSAAVRCPGAVVRIIGVAQLELAILEGVIPAEEPGSYVNLVVVVRRSAEPVVHERIPVRLSN